MPVPTLRMKNDKPLRDRLYTPEAYQHPAKGHLGMWQEMILRYSKEGDTVLDPMSGVGATLLAALMGRTAILVELEPHFVAPMQASWAKMQQHPMLGYTMGQAVILRGDARHLPLCSADVVLTSPPYADSPVAQSSDGEANRRFRAGEYQGDALRGMGLSEGYTRQPQVDAVVTSPPYQMPNTGLESGAHPAEREYNHDIRYAPQEKGENIGNLRSTAYFEAMCQVYAECWRVLRPGGVMALVLKGFTRDGQYVDLPGQTEALLLAAGWEKHDHWRRELWSLSFWRILQKRRDPAAFDERLNFEEVLAFRKPGGDGLGAWLGSR